MKKSKSQNALPVVRTQVKAFLTRSSAFRALAPDRRREIAGDMTKIANYLASSEANSGDDQAVNNVEFPDFVSDLLTGVFDAIVDASVKQMEEYAKLLAAASKSVDEFTKKRPSDRQAYDHLFDRVPEFSLNSERKKKRSRVRLASGRQQALATMVLMGINRIVVTDGKIRAK